MTPLTTKPRVIYAAGGPRPMTAEEIAWFDRERELEFKHDAQFEIDNPDCDLYDDEG